MFSRATSPRRIGRFDFIRETIHHHGFVSVEIMTYICNRRQGAKAPILHICCSFVVQHFENIAHCTDIQSHKSISSLIASASN